MKSLEEFESHIIEKYRLAEAYETKSVADVYWDILKEIIDYKTNAKQEHKSND